MKDANKKNILIIENDKEWQAQLLEYIEDMGYEANLARNAQEAISMIVSNSSEYDCIFLDMRLTKNEDRLGFMVLEQMKERNIYIPCILISAYLTKDALMELMNEYKSFIVKVLDKSNFSEKPSKVSNALRSALQIKSSKGYSKEQQNTILFDVLNKRLSQEELKRFCFFLKIEYNDLEGSSKKNKISELISYLIRHNQIFDLINLLKERRSDIDISWYNNY